MGCLHHPPRSPGGASTPAGRGAPLAWISRRGPLSVGTAAAPALGAAAAPRRRGPAALQKERPGKVSAPELQLPEKIKGGCVLAIFGFRGALSGAWGRQETAQTARIAAATPPPAAREKMRERDKIQIQRNRERERERERERDNKETEHRGRRPHCRKHGVCLIGPSRLRPSAGAQSEEPGRRERRLACRRARPNRPAKGMRLEDTDRAAGDEAAEGAGQAARTRRKLLCNGRGPRVAPHCRGDARCAATGTVRRGRRPRIWQGAAHIPLQRTRAAEAQTALQGERPLRSNGRRRDPRCRRGTAQAVLQRARTAEDAGRAAGRAAQAALQRARAAEGAGRAAETRLRGRISAAWVRSQPNRGALRDARLHGPRACAQAIQPTSQREEEEEKEGETNQPFPTNQPD